jgi:hypothetical protein
MYMQNSKSRLAVAVGISVWLFIGLGCDKAPTIDRVSITPSVTPGQKAERIEVTSTTSPTPLTPGQQAELSVDVSQQGSNLKVQWLAPPNKGYFTRPTDNLSTTFVAPNEPGLVEIACLVGSNGETQVVHLPVLVVGQATPSPTAPVSSPLPATAQNVAPYDVENGGFVPCGWMGDGEDGETYLRVQDSSDLTPSGAPSRKWSFRPGGKKGWLAVGWQFGDCNWGDAKGVDLKSRGFKRVTVWAKGVPDSEKRFPVIQFKAGGNADPQKKYKASFTVANEFITLTADWKPYYLDLQGEDLSSVISAFTFALRSKDHPKGATFYLGGINYNAGN